MAEHGEDDFQHKYVGYVSLTIGGIVLVAGLLGIYVTTF